MTRSILDKIRDDYDLATNKPSRREIWLKRRLVMAFFFAIPCALFLVGLSRSGNRVFVSPSFSSSHAALSNNCQQCHEPWRTADRMVSLNNAHRSVEDRRCIECHRGMREGSADHFVSSPRFSGAVQVAAGFEIGCAQCHHEHQGKQRLAEVADARCVQCHSDLTKAAHGESIASLLKDQSQIRQFSNLASGGVTAHPKFDLENRETSSFQVLLDGTTHPWSGKAERWEKETYWPLNSVADVADSAIVANWSGGDKSSVKFNHMMHLKPILRRRASGASSSRTDDESKPQLFEQLDCASCHTTDSRGEYMRPIRFEEHCKKCHPLAFHADSAAAGPLPHEKLSVVRSVVLSRLLAARPETQQARTPRLPNKDAVQLVSDSDRIMQLVTDGCKKCHSLENGQIEPTKIPIRWMPGGKFSHRRHRDQFPKLSAMENCFQCHKQEAVEKSQRTSDVLMPTIDDCRSCHTSRNSNATTRANCTMCHQYHRHGKPLISLKGGGQAER